MMESAPTVHRPAHHVTVSTLGVCSVSIDGVIAANVPSSLYRIGSYLLLSGTNRTVSRQRLSAVFWPDSDQASANLRQSLSRIRRTQELGGFQFVESNFSLIYLVMDGVEWDLPKFLFALDCTDEQAIVRACELYSGDLLADIGASSDAFEEWLSEQRDRLRSAYIDKVGGAIAGEVEMTAGARSRCARKLLAIDPCNEQAYQALMMEAADHGDIARVHELFERCERQLMSELGVRSSAGTRGLYSQLARVE